MGARSSAESHELKFMLWLIGQKYNSKDIGLYIDHGVSVFNNTSGTEFEKVENTHRRYSKKKC